MLVCRGSARQSPAKPWQTGLLYFGLPVPGTRTQRAWRLSVYLGWADNPSDSVLWTNLCPSPVSRVCGH